MGDATRAKDDESTVTKADEAKAKAEAKQVEDERDYSRTDRTVKERADRQAQLEADAPKTPEHAPDPEKDKDQFSSLLERDTTHWQNVHFGSGGPVDRIGSWSSAARVNAVQALMAATGMNVEPTTGWDEATANELAKFQGEQGSGEVDRATWDKLSDKLFAEPEQDASEPKPPESIAPG